MPLYSRLKRKEILDHFKRGLIYGYILTNPGEHYNAIKRGLNLNNGPLTYHLNVLEREGFIKSNRDNIYKRFYPLEMKVPTDNTVSPVKNLILGLIDETPGISQKEIASLLGLRPPTVNYHMGKLIDAGFIRTERKGMRVCYFKVEGYERD